MEARKSKQQFRNTLVVLGVIIGATTLIFVLSAIFIGIANGLRPGADGLVQTGSMRLNSEPAAVKVLLNGEQRNLINRIADGINPGTYRLSVSADGYLPWEKEVEIRAGLLEEVSVKLFPSELELRQVTSSDIQRVVFANSGDYAYYVVANGKTANENGIWRQRLVSGGLNIFTADNQKILDLSGELLASVKTGNYSLILSPDNQRLVLALPGATPVHYVLDAGGLNTTASLQTLEQSVPFSFQTVSWLGNADRLLLGSGELLVDFNWRSRESRVVALRRGLSAQQYTVVRGNVYLVGADGASLDVYENGVVRTLKLVSKLPTNITSLTSGSLSEASLYLSTGSGELYYFHLVRDYLFNLGKVTLVTTSPDSRAAIVRNAEQNLLSFGVHEQRALNVLEPKLGPINLTDYVSADISLAEVGFTSSSANTLFRLSNGQLYVGDREGANLAKLTDSKLPVGSGEYGVNSNSSEGFLLLNDSQDKTSKNLYAVKL